MRDYKLYLKDILAAMESIESFVEGMSFEEFRVDDKTTSLLSGNSKLLERRPNRYRMRFESSIQKCPGRRWLACGIG